MLVLSQYHIFESYKTNIYCAILAPDCVYVNAFQCKAQCKLG
jgi:hypothetical protein